MRIGVSLPRLPQRLMVRVETRRMPATSETVRRSGRLARSRLGLVVATVWLSLSMYDMEVIKGMRSSQDTRLMVRWLFIEK